VSSTVCLGDSWLPYGLLLGTMKVLGKAPYVNGVSRSDLLAATAARRPGCS
jgi:hypothetical protein